MSKTLEIAAKVHVLPGYDKNQFVLRRAKEDLALALAHKILEHFEPRTLTLLDGTELMLLSLYVSPAMPKQEKEG